MNAEIKHTTLDDVSAQIADLSATALRIKDERDRMAESLCEIAHTAWILIEMGYASADCRAFAQEVKRLAKEGLGQ